jgi:hypothetical protein
MFKLKSILINAAITTATATLLFLGYTAYNDHLLVKALVQIEQQRQAAPKAP